MKQLSINKSLESNVRELLTEETKKHDREYRSIISLRRINRTPHVEWKRNIALKSIKKSLSRVQIITRQTS